MAYTKTVEVEVVTTNFSDYAFSIRKIIDPHFFADMITINFWPKEHDIESTCFEYTDEEKKCVLDGLMPIIKPHRHLFKPTLQRECGNDFTLWFDKNHDIADEDEEMAILEGEKELHLSPERQADMNTVFDNIMKYLTAQGLEERNDIIFD